MSTHRQPSRKGREQKLLEEGKMRQQEIQALEKKLKKQKQKQNTILKKGPVKFTDAL